MSDVKFALHIMIHPFDGFYDMKYEKKGKIKVSIAIMFLVALAMIFEHQVTAFLFNPDKNVPVDVLSKFRNVAIIALLWTISNWSVTTLMDGEGNMRDILMVIGYAMVPYIIVRVPTAILTNFMSLSEEAYIDFLFNLGLCWSAILVFIGTMVVHQYSFMKTFFTVILTIAAMAIIIFICMVFFDLIWQIIGFLTTIYKEIMLRL